MGLREGRYRSIRDDINVGQRKLGAKAHTTENAAALPKLNRTLFCRSIQTGICRDSQVAEGHK